MALEISGKFGKNDATYIALGKKPGIRELVDIFTLICKSHRLKWINGSHA